MVLKDYAKKKIISKIGEIATVHAVNETTKLVDKHNEANSLSNKQKTNINASSTNTLSNQSFFEQPTINKLIMNERVVSLRKSYTISDMSGNVLYKAKSVGLPKLPEMALYDSSNSMIGLVEKGLMGNPVFTIKLNDEQIASLYHKASLKPKFEIPENGWIVEGGFSKTIIYDNVGAIAAQIQYKLSSEKDAIIIEYPNKDNEIPIILITLAAIIAYRM